MDPLTEFFSPKSIAVIGASCDENKLGYGVARNILLSRYSGDVFLINPKGGELFGKKIFRSLEFIEEEIELALIVVPASIVPNTIIACSHKQIKNLILYSSGFKESGAEGAKLEQLCQKLIKENGMRVLGPNCIGLIDTETPLDCTFIQPPMPEKGKLAFITQSGALGAALIDWARGDGFGISRLVSLGNLIDLDESDIIGATANSDSTHSIMLYLESLKNGQKFIATASDATQKKPIVVLKAGVSSAGESAALSHTGALAGSNAAYDAVFRRTGIIKARTAREMYDWAKLLAFVQEPADNRLAILTNAGGPGVIATDFVESNGLRMAQISKETSTILNQALPDAASIKNPIDMLASASPETFAVCLQALLEDQNVDIVLVIAPPPPTYTSLELSECLIKVLTSTNKPVVISLMGNLLVHEAINKLRENSIPYYSFPEEAVAGLGALWKYYSYKRQVQQVARHTQVKKGSRNLQKHLDLNHSNSFLSDEVISKILKEYKIPTVQLKLAENEVLASDIASEFGFPIVMKVSMDRLSHKSDIGGVLLDIRSESDVRQGFNDLKNIAKENPDKGDFRGVYLQKMVPGGQEVVVGAVRDPIFGPMVMFGSGGVEVEQVRDVQFALAPVTETDLDYLISSTQAGKKLVGFRNQEKRNKDFVKEIIVKISQIIVDFPEIIEIDLNPLILGQGSSESYVVDTRIVVNPVNGK